MEQSAAAKLVDLLESAAPEDRKAITAWLLERAPAPAPTEPGPSAPGFDFLLRYGSPPIGAMSRVGRTRLGDERLERLRGALAPGEESQLVTLRLPQERHAQLRQWCGEHDFSMAAVIRGLVEQFLETRARPDAEPPAPG